MYIVQWLRSLIFIVQMYLAMFILALFFVPMTLFKREHAYWAAHTYGRWVRWTACWMIGLRSEIRGEIPTGEVLVASKHQSFFDIIMIISTVPQPKFIMKAELRYAPVLGWFAVKMGCVAVKRGKRSTAIKKMIENVKSGMQLPGQLIIYPQGTRVAAGSYLPYKVGVAVLHQQTGQHVVPTATNVGVFWPRHGIYRKPGLAVLEFLPPLASAPSAKFSTGAFMKQLEEVIEPASNRLMAEAGFKI